MLVEERANSEQISFTGLVLPTAYSSTLNGMNDYVTRLCFNRSFLGLEFIERSRNKIASNLLATDKLLYESS